MNEKKKERESNQLIIKSFRTVDQWVSNDVINRCEDGLAEIDPQISVAGIEKFFYYIKKIFTNRYVFSNTLFRLLYQGSQSIFSKKTKESLFVTCISPYLFDIFGFYKTKGVKIAFIIDAWESSIEYIAENIDLADIILIAYQDSIHFLRKHLSREKMKKVFLFPNFINPKIYPNESIEKLYDMIQIGRRNDILHQWAIKYSNEKKYSYIFQKRNQHGMYYLENRDWEAENYQLSYPSLIKVLSQSKIALVSPPDRADSKRTGRISPLTHRYLEAAMCRAVTVGFTPTSGEYAHHFPKDFTIVPKDYGEFEGICDRLIDDDNLRTGISHKNRNYVIENHSVAARYRQLQEIIMNNRSNKTEQISNDNDLFHNNINKKIKVLEVINSLKIGGAELLLRNFVIEAKKDNQYTVDVCTLYATNEAKNIEEIEKKNVRIWSLDLKNKYSLSSVGKIKKIIKRENYDIIHVHLFPASAFVALSSLFLPNNIGYIFTEHSTFNRRRTIKIFKIVDGFIYSRYSKIICSSKQVQNSLIKWIPKNKEKTEVIHNGTPIHSKPVVEQIIKNYDILFVGRLVPQKGIRFLLEAINILQNKYKKNIKVAIVGEGPLGKKLKTMCEKLKIDSSVEFLGFRRDIDQLMKSSKLFVLPSCWEGFGIVLIEAMKNKLPIVATNVGGIPEIITDGNEGLLVPKENPEILASSINYVLEDEKLRSKLIQNAYRKVQKKYSIEKYTVSLLNLYFNILNK